MSATEASGVTRRRDPDAGIIGGVCAGVAAQLGWDVLLVRIAFGALAFAGGIGLVAYLLMWALVPAEGGSAAVDVPRLAGRGGLEVGVGVGLLVLALLLPMRALGVWWSDVIIWPLVGLAAGGALLWRGAAGPADPELALEDGTSAEDPV